MNAAAEYPDPRHRAHLLLRDGAMIAGYLECAGSVRDEFTVAARRVAGQLGSARANLLPSCEEDAVGVVTG